MSARGRKSANPLDKKVPENPKYKHVRATVDTGASISRYMERIDELKRDVAVKGLTTPPPMLHIVVPNYKVILRRGTGGTFTSTVFGKKEKRARPRLFKADRYSLYQILWEYGSNYNFRKDELFKRMKVTTFVQLVLQVAEFDNHQMLDDDLAYGDTSRSDRPDTADDEVAHIQRGGNLDPGEPADTTEDNSLDTSRSRLQQVITGTGEIDLEAPKARPVPAAVDCPYLLLDVRDQDAFDECHIISAKSYPTAMLARSVNYETKDMLKFKNQPGKIILVYDDEERISHRAATTLVQRGYDNLFMLSGGLKVAYKLFPDGLITGTLPSSIWDEIHPPSKNPKHREEQKKVPADIPNFTMDCVDQLTLLLDGALTDRSVGSRLSKASRAGRSTSMTSTSSFSALGKKPFK